MKIIKKIIIEKDIKLIVPDSFWIGLLYPTLSEEENKGKGFSISFNLPTTSPIKSTDRLTRLIENAKRKQ